MPKCPYCNNYISKNTIKCEYCSESLEAQCPYCKETININDTVCPFCSSNLKTESISIIVKITYVLLLFNALFTSWFANLIVKHPVFWHEMVKKNDDFYDFISLLVGIAVISVIPSIVGIVNNYRKQVCTIAIIACIVFCICNIYLVLNIN